MATHYDVLGVAPTASYDEVRHAYLERARAVHPDRVVEGTASEAERRARTMQEVNEAWRVLRDPANRSAYDRALAGGGRPAAMQSGPSPWPPRHDPLDDEDDLDVPYRSALAQPGDLGVSMARALPWLALVAILVIIFVFTAFATGSGRNASGPHALVGRCITSGLGSAIDPVPCQGPNEGQVVLVVDRASLCPDGSTSRSVPGNVWLCLKPFIPMPTGPRTTASR